MRPPAGSARISKVRKDGTVLYFGNTSKKLVSNMYCELIDHMGTDITVVDAARVSFSKRASWKMGTDLAVQELSERDKKLIQYLAKHNHWTPFGHCSLSFHIAVPIFVARQLQKSQVGLCWNEVSRRYVDSSPQVWMPSQWRGRPTDKKQGSSDEIIEWADRETRVSTVADNAMKNSIEAYQTLIESGVAPEQARMVLPMNTMTEFFWSGSLPAFARVCNLRCKEDTQQETQEVANLIDGLAKDKFPVSWEALRG